MIDIKQAPRYLYFVNALQHLMFCLPVLMLFYQYKNVSQGDFFFIQGLALGAVFLLEIPSGYIADIFSRKSSLIIGMFGWLFGYLCWIFGSGFFFMLIGELIFAVGISFISGTLDAYLYDLLKKRNKQRLYHKKLSKMSTFGNVGLFFSSITGAFLYQFIGPEATVGLCMVSIFIAALILMILPDVPEAKRKVEKGKSKIKDIFEISNLALKNKEIKWLMIFPAAYGALTLTLMWGLQSVMIATNVPVFMFSIMVSLNSFMRIVWSICAGSVLEFIGLNKSVFALCGLLLISLLCASLSVIVPPSLVYIFLIMMILSSSSRVLCSLISTTLINHKIQSNERATVLSVKSMIDRICSCFAMLALKPLFDSFGVSLTFMIASVLIIPILISGVVLAKLKIKMTD
ncbi:MAG: MFS transporter [Alphaproteobacteria bacterium]|nr:MFS transporter [Alphaproteobacteria bacterium]